MVGTGGSNRCLLFNAGHERDQDREEKSRYIKKKWLRQI